MWLRKEPPSNKNLLQTVTTEAQSSPIIIVLILHIPCPFTSSRWNYQSAPLALIDFLQFPTEPPSSHILLVFQLQRHSSLQLETQCPDFIPSHDSYHHKSARELSKSLWIGLSQNRENTSLWSIIDQCMGSFKIIVFWKELFSSRKPPQQEIRITHS